MKSRILTVIGAAAVAAATLAGCAGGGEEASEGGGDLEGVELTYWANLQGPSIEADTEMLQAEMDKFTEQTGIEVDVQVMTFNDLTPATLSATVSGQGPDVINIGNTNATTLQTTGAFMPFTEDIIEQLGGRDRFIDAALETAGPDGSDPTSLPLFSQVYGLYYNRQILEDAGVEPPETWEDLVAAAEQLTDPAAGRYGLVVPTGAANISMHLAYIVTRQNGVTPFEDDGTPAFTSDGMVAAIDRYVELMEDGVLNPSTIEYTDRTNSAADFASGKAAMYPSVMGDQSSIINNGMTQEDFGVVPLPSPAGGEPVASFVAGSNISVFDFSEHKDAALELVDFLLSDEEQEILSAHYGTLPVIDGIPASALADYPDKLDVWTSILADQAVAAPLVPDFTAFQTNVGSAVVDLMSRAATGQEITEDDVRAALTEAEQKMATS